MSREFREKAEALGFELLEGVLSRMPWETLQAIGRAAGLAFHAIDARHRRVVRDNIRNTDLGLSEPEVRALSRECFAYFGSLFFSGVRLFTMPEDELLRRVKVVGEENYRKAMAGGKGFIVLTGHYGNWEAVALALSQRGCRMSVIGRALKNPLLENRLRQFRGRFGNEVIAKDGAFRGSIQALRQGKGVGFLLDQDALSFGVFVKFLGRWGSTFASAGVLAVKYRVPVVQVRSWPEPDGSITVAVEPPFEVPVTGDQARDIWTATQIMARRIEAEIRRDPRFWFWMHNRWKTRPGDNTAPELPDPSWGTGL